MSRVQNLISETDGRTSERAKSERANERMKIEKLGVGRPLLGPAKKGSWIPGSRHSAGLQGGEVRQILTMGDKGGRGGKANANIGWQRGAGFWLLMISLITAVSAARWKVRLLQWKMVFKSPYFREVPEVIGHSHCYKVKCIIQYTIKCTVCCTVQSNLKCIVHCNVYYWL